MCIFPPCRTHFEAKGVWQSKRPLRPCSIVQYYSYNLIMPWFTRYFVTELSDDAFWLGETELLTGIADLLFALWAFDTEFWWPSQLWPVAAVLRPWGIAQSWWLRVFQVQHPKLKDSFDLYLHMPHFCVWWWTFISQKETWSLIYLCFCEALGHCRRKCCRRVLTEINNSVFKSRFK